MEKYNIAIELTQDEQKVLVGQMNDCRKKLLEEDKAPWKRWERSIPAIPDYAK